MKRVIKTNELYASFPFYLDILKQYEYPWQILPDIKGICRELISKGIVGFKQITENVLVGPNVKIAENVTIEGAAIIGENSEIRTGAYIRGNVITGAHCVLGNSSEFKNCILLDNVQAPHYSYIGDSVIGNRVHLGASAICSNLKGDNKPVIIHADEDIPTHLRKVGAFLGDGADIGSGCIINPGTIIGKGSRVYPLTSLRGAYPENHIIKSQKEFTEMK